MARRRAQHPEAKLEEVARRADHRRVPTTGLRPQWWIYLTRADGQPADARGPAGSRGEALSRVQEYFAADTVGRYVGAWLRLSWR